MIQKDTAYDIAMKNLDDVARLMNLSDEVTGYFRNPRRIMVVDLPLRMDDGSLRFYTGYRAQHVPALGPTKGGTRFHKDETMEDVKALSFWMSIKNSLSHIPAGGAKGGIAVDPATLSHGELERLCRAYVRAVFPMLGPNVDIPGPDIGTPQQVMGWFADEYELLNHGHAPEAFAAKPPIIGGSEGRDGATGRGLVDVAEKILELNNESLQGKTIAIQGFGNLGSYAARFFTKAGARVVAVSDVNGGIYSGKGIDPFSAMKYLAENGKLAGFAGTESITNAELLAVQCDILTPCALQGQITAANAGKIRARYILEGANGPTTPEAEAIVRDMGVCVIPDILSNAGGAIVSYLEMVQNLSRYYWPEEEVYAKLKLSMQTTAAKVWHAAGERNVALRQAGWIIAIGRIVEAMALRGMIRR